MIRWCRLRFSLAECFQSLQEQEEHRQKAQEEHEQADNVDLRLANKRRRLLQTPVSGVLAWLVHEDHNAASIYTVE